MQIFFMFTGNAASYIWQIVFNENEIIDYENNSLFIVVVIKIIMSIISLILFRK